MGEGIKEGERGNVSIISELFAFTQIQVLCEGVEGVASQVVLLFGSLVSPGSADPIDSK